MVMVMIDLDGSSPEGRQVCNGMIGRGIGWLGLLSVPGPAGVVGMLTCYA